MKINNHHKFLLNEMNQVMTKRFFLCEPLLHFSRLYE